MARSKHTDPNYIRAARRTMRPSGKRGESDLARANEIRRRLKEVGIDGRIGGRVLKGRRVRPRIIVHAPRAGFYHPARKKDVLELLEKLGVEIMYGLRTVELRRTTFPDDKNVFQFGRYEAPGRIILYEQRAGIWKFPGRLGGKVERLLRKAGAIVSRDGGTSVRWPDERLKNFMLENVLAHEAGHHVLQQYKGKRRVRGARKVEHEKFAELYRKKMGSGATAGEVAG